MHAILKAIQSRPGLYFGGSKHPLTSIVAFISGYNIGLTSARDSEIGITEDLMPRDFDAFVSRHFGLAPGQDTKGWSTHVREHTKTELEAFELLFRLLESYETENSK